MKNTIEYKKYRALVEYSVEDECFIGKVLGINYVIIFDGNTIEELTQAFHDSVDTYLSMCEANDLKPEREFSGNLHLRVSSEKHRELVNRAEANGISLNSLLNQGCDLILEAV